MEGLRVEGRGSRAGGSWLSTLELQRKGIRSVSEANGICDAALTHRTAVLMARIVDGVGQVVRRSDIEVVRYSIHELDGRHVDNDAAVPGHDAVVLNVDEVFFDSLQTGGLWTMDDVGYNFRHEIGVSGDRAFAKAGARYQIWYELRPSTGEKTIVRFQIGC